MAIDLFCGLGGWAEGFLAEGYGVIGFDIERHDYGTGGYPGWLVLQDIRTVHGSQFKDAASIVASPPCQKYSYMAMPWSRAKQMAAEYRSGVRSIAELNELFDACFRIQREACEAAGRYIPLIVENVKGAQSWVGPAKWHYGSFYLWGDVPALMPTTHSLKVPGFNFHQHEKTGESGGSFQSAAVAGVKNPGIDWSKYGQPDYKPVAFNDQSIKNAGGSWFNVAHNTESGHGQNPDGRKTENGGTWFTHGDKHWKEGACITRLFNSKSSARKAASAQIAKIPFPLARHIARCFKHVEVGA